MNYKTLRKEMKIKLFHTLKKLNKEKAQYRTKIKKLKKENDIISSKIKNYKEGYYKFYELYNNKMLS